MLPVYEQWLRVIALIPVYLFMGPYLFTIWTKFLLYPTTDPRQLQKSTYILINPANLRPTSHFIWRLNPLRTQSSLKWSLFINLATNAGANAFFRDSTTVLAFAAEAILVKPSLAKFKMLINCCYQHISYLMKHLLKTNIINDWISALICSDLVIKSLIFSLVTFGHCCLNQLGCYNYSLFLIYKILFK